MRRTWIVPASIAVAGLGLIGAVALLSIDDPPVVTRVSADPTPPPADRRGLQCLGGVVTITRTFAGGAKGGFSSHEAAAEGMAREHIRRHDGIERKEADPRHPAAHAHFARKDDRRVALIRTVELTPGTFVANSATFCQDRFKDEP